MLLDRELPVAWAHWVLVDHRQGIVEAVEHLAKLGHRRIGFIGGTLVIRPGRERLRHHHQLAADVAGLDLGQSLS